MFEKEIDSLKKRCAVYSPSQPYYKEFTTIIDAAINWSLNVKDPAVILIAKKDGSEGFWFDPQEIFPALRLTIKGWKEGEEQCLRRATSHVQTW